MRRLLEAVVRARHISADFQQRAWIVLLAGQGLTNVAIARRLRCTETTARKWRERFRDRPRMTTLFDAQRSGRPSTVPMFVRLELIKIACDRPADCKLPFRDVWTIDLLRTALFQSTGWLLSQSEIRRILAVEEIRPHHVRLWLHSPDPEFRPKVRAICDVYLTKPVPGDLVLCVDEKTGMQALEHKHPFKQAVRGRSGRREFEYIRHGTRTLFAAFNPHTGAVIGECSRSRKADDLMRFMERVAKAYPTGNVTIVWDNLNIHKGERWLAFNRRHGGRFRFLYTPIHASWVNQVEIWFSILARRVLKHGSFATAKELVRAVEGFVRHWNKHEGHPFRWTFRGRFKRRAA
jgi:transposase